MSKVKKFDIYLIGVGGQGIGLLSEVLIRAADYAGYSVRGVDTHGLAQRGGTVSSHIRMGEGIYSPIIKEASADMVIALEINEALRGVNSHLKDGGVLVYYDALWQHLFTRLGKGPEVKEKDIHDECNLRGIKTVKVFREDLEDARMQNVAVLGKISDLKLIPGVGKEDYEKALGDLLPEKVLKKNLEVFSSV